MQTDAINHDPAVTFFQTGFQLAGRPSIGAWISYGLGSENQDLPAFVVMVSQGAGNSQALADRQWGSGFLPTRYQGVKFRSGADPVLYLSNPAGLFERGAPPFPGRSGEAERDRTLKEYQDPEISTRIAQYEMAYRMQTLRARADGSFEGARVHLRAVRSGFAQARHLCRQLHSGAPPGRARRALHPALPSRLGPAQQSAAERFAASACRPTSPPPR